MFSKSQPTLKKFERKEFQTSLTGEVKKKKKKNTFVLKRPGKLEVH